MVYLTDDTVRDMVASGRTFYYESASGRYVIVRYFEDRAIRGAKMSAGAWAWIAATGKAVSDVRQLT